MKTAGEGTPLGVPPSSLSAEVFVERYGDIYENAAWVAEALCDEARTGALDSKEALQARMAAVVDAADHERKLALIRAHPDLAGRAAAAGALSPASRAEQSGAGLDRLTPEQAVAFKRLNQGYKAKFGFPFVISVRGLDAQELLEAFEQRLGNPPDTEFAMAIAEIHRIARHRLEAVSEDTRSWPR